MSAYADTTHGLDLSGRARLPGWQRGERARTLIWDVIVLGAALMAVAFLIEGVGFFEPLKNLFDQHLFTRAMFGAGAACGLLVFFFTLANRAQHRLSASFTETAADFFYGGMTGLLLHTFFFALPGGVLPMLPLTAVWGILVGAVALGRLVRYLARSRARKTPVVIFGSGTLAQKVAQTLGVGRKSRYSVLAQLPATGSAAGEAPADTVISGMKSLAADYPAGTAFVIADEKFSLMEVDRVGRFAAENNIDLAIVPPANGFGFAHFEVHRFFNQKLPLLTVRAVLPSELGTSLKRALDMAAAAGLLALLSPFLLMIGFLIRLDGGSAMFAHKRVGRYGRRFNCYKFRTMVPDAQGVLDRYLEANPKAMEEWRATHKLKDDPRVTRFGQFLRKTSLDELPQLINVLQGHMSLVGPRPIVDAEIEKYDGAFSYYARVRPGITGLWQVSGRNNTTYEQRVEYDTWYVQNWSIWLDLYIMLKTVPEVLFSRGAY